MFGKMNKQHIIEMCLSGNKPIKQYKAVNQLKKKIQSGNFEMINIIENIDSKEILQKTINWLQGGH